MQWISCLTLYMRSNSSQLRNALHQLCVKLGLSGNEGAVPIQSGSVVVFEKAVIADVAIVISRQEEPRRIFACFLMSRGVSNPNGTAELQEHARDCELPIANRFTCRHSSSERYNPFCRTLKELDIALAPIERRVLQVAAGRYRKPTKDLADTWRIRRTDVKFFARVFRAS